MTIQDKIAALPPEPPIPNGAHAHDWAIFNRDLYVKYRAERDLALEVLRFTQCLCSVHVTCDRCAVLAACGGDR